MCSFDNHMVLWTDLFSMAYQAFVGYLKTKYIRKNNYFSSEYCTNIFLRKAIVFPDVLIF